MGKADMAKDLWKYIDSWRLCEGREWLDNHGPNGPPMYRKRSTGESPPKMTGLTVTFQVPPPRAAPSTQFLRESAKTAGAMNGDEYSLPSELNLVFVAAENAKLVEALEAISDYCLVASVVTHEDVGLNKVADMAAVALMERGTGAEILERMRLQRELVLEKSVEVSAHLLKKLDV